jgi:hypothetical protein
MSAAVIAFVTGEIANNAVTTDAQLLPLLGV